MTWEWDTGAHGDEQLLCAGPNTVELPVSGSVLVRLSRNLLGYLPTKRRAAHRHSPSREEDHTQHTGQGQGRHQGQAAAEESGQNSPIDQD